MWITIERERDYEWWRNCLEGRPVGFHDDDAHAGWFVAEKKIPKSDAYRIPAVFYWSGPIDDIGSLVGDCELQASIAGHACNAYGLWTRVCHKPITIEEYDALMEQDYDRYFDIIQGIVAACRNC